MKPSFGAAVVAAGASGLLGFALLALAIGSDYWYVVDAEALRREDNSSFLSAGGLQSSHAGLWSFYEGTNNTQHVIPAEASNHTDLEKHLLGLHRVVVMVLPLSLVLLVVGGVTALFSSLTHSICLLKGSAIYLLLCSLLTLSGVSVYISYSQQALAEVRRVVGEEILSHVQLSFGWSLAVACLSVCLQASSGALLLLAVHLSQRPHYETSASAMLEPQCSAAISLTPQTSTAVTPE
ncbi:transmembrane protein 235 isoform X2 [Denticeps clupeoides]|uniref:transmembrane protein 235 isoform X2 n=1 Tax=Denticeps clupeoides TaxID=299321 RepID=UPI0010A2E647|nr:transmembrane protein 235-like isoform X2 [Denticeps clupeoides]